MLQQPSKRDQAGSLTAVRPHPAAQTTAQVLAECGGNLQLLEARVCELTTSIRALYKSNQDLQQALVASPDDADFVQAMDENRTVILRQADVAAALCREMQARGASVSLEPDIQQAVAAVELEQAQAEAAATEAAAREAAAKEAATKTSEGLYL